MATAAPSGCRAFFGGGDDLDAAAKAIGISTDTLRTDLRNGQTIAAVAEAKNVSTQTVIDAMVAAEKTELDAAVKAGHLTSDPRSADREEPHPALHRPGERHHGEGSLRARAARASAPSGCGVTSAAVTVSTPRPRRSASAPTPCAPTCATARPSPRSPRSKNVSTKTVIDAMVAAEKTELAAAVKAGRLSADAETKIEANLTDDDHEPRERHAAQGRPFGPGGPGFGPGMHGHWGDGSSNGPGSGTGSTNGAVDDGRRPHRLIARAAASPSLRSTKHRCSWRERWRSRACVMRCHGLLRPEPGAAALHVGGRGHGARPGARRRLLGSGPRRCCSARSGRPPRITISRSVKTS